MSNSNSISFGFHYRDGLFFRRNEDRSVTITKMKTAHSEEKEISLETTIDENSWASIIASVSEQGESNGRFYKALEWHNDLPPQSTNQ